MRLWRAHGLGNVYLVQESGPPLWPDLVRALCDGAVGVGADGVLEPVATAAADHGVRIWNPDGSVAEKSGNGLRILARWLAERGAGAAFTVSTGPCVVRCEVRADAIAVEMGRAIVGPEAPLPPPAPAGVAWIAVDVGNPHCVAFVDAVDAVDWRAWGAVMERHPAFPNRTNVQVAALVPGGVAIRVWERGAGPTPASGSSACAVAAAAVATGRLAPGRIAVIAPGGALSVEVDAGLDLRLEGPVEGVGWIEVDPGWLARRGR
jgi:diaminopimelate epimerase